MWTVNINNNTPQTNENLSTKCKNGSFWINDWSFCWKLSMKDKPCFVKLWETYSSSKRCWYFWDVLFVLVCLHLNKIFHTYIILHYFITIVIFFIGVYFCWLDCLLFLYIQFFFVLVLVIVYFFFFECLKFFVFV